MCDTLCVRTQNATIFAKNSDRNPDEPQVVEWHPRRARGGELRTQYLTLDDPGAFAFLGSRPTWLWGVEHGVNEHGVAVGNEKIWTVDNPKTRAAALIGMDLVRLALEGARSAYDALTIITTRVERYGQGGSGEPHREEPYDSAFLVADGRAGFIIETSDRTWAAREIGPGAAISNRINLGTNWTSASPDVPVGADFDRYRWARMPTALADHRLEITSATVARGADTTIADVAHALRNHGTDRSAGELPGEVGDDWSGYSVCMHRRESFSQTTASMIAELRTDGPPRAWVCLGNPCLSVYVPVFGPAVAPEVADEAQWRRFAQLRDRVEAAPDRLGEAQEILVPVEAELWTDADTVVAAGDPTAVAAWAKTAYAPVDAALRRLGV